MFKKSLFILGLVITLMAASGSVFACGGANSGKHIGNVTSVDKAGSTFTIRDMETNSPKTFKANGQIMANIDGASGNVMVNYEEDEEGSLVAVGVTF